MQPSPGPVFDSVETADAPGISRRRLLVAGAATATAALPLFGSPAHASVPVSRDIRFIALWQGSPVGAHHVTFRMEADRVTVSTRIDITVKVLFFTVFRLKHLAREVWRGGRLESVESTTEQDGALLEVSGHATGQGFRIVGSDGPYLADGHLMTSNSLWDIRVVRETRLIDVQHGGEIGLFSKLLGDTQPGMQQQQAAGQASQYHLITPYYAGRVFYDGDQRWVRALIEYKGETVEYVPEP
ncbi:DUF6134 family protein [Oceanibaculum nanhaiense]|uniref:DUF6134 family protein n=1 Tax=Oceanibaculum nanhaiense TaxID=1909734 RepID=UPI003F71682A